MKNSLEAIVKSSEELARINDSLLKLSQEQLACRKAYSDLLFAWVMQADPIKDRELIEKTIGIIKFYSDQTFESIANDSGRPT